MTLRSFTLGLLLLALGAALPVHGWAMGTMARVADAVVICSGSGSYTALIDWRGEKVDPVPNCPDCMPAAGLGLITAAPTLAAAPGNAARLSGTVQPRLLPTDAPGHIWPRAPPV